jgi:hypothetical protein
VSKEAAYGITCACGLTVAFYEYHLPHCGYAMAAAQKESKRRKKKDRPRR